jgi:hypothetical protein
VCNTIQQTRGSDGIESRIRGKLGHGHKFSSSRMGMFLLLPLSMDMTPGSQAIECGCTLVTLQGVFRPGTEAASLFPLVLRLPTS